VAHGEALEFKPQPGLNKKKKQQEFEVVKFLEILKSEGRENLGGKYNPCFSSFFYKCKVVFLTTCNFISLRNDCVWHLNLQWDLFMQC
jgi:hypothetical protein